MENIDLMKMTLAGEILPGIVGQFSDSTDDLIANADKYVECAKILAEKLYNAYEGI